MPDANVPVLGKVNKGTMVAALAAAGVVGGYMLYKHNKKKSSTASTATPAANAGTAGAYGYGQYAYGYGLTYPNADAYGYGAFGYGMYNPYSGGYVGAAGTPYPQTIAVATNQEWVQEAVNSLKTQGYDGQAIIGALALYITGQPVSSAQEAFVQAAIAVAGYPPQPGANGYPPAINHQGAPGGGGQGGGAGRLSQPHALHVSNATGNSIQIAWDNVNGATGYKVQLKKGGSNGQTVSGPFDSSGPFANFSGLQPKTKYTAFVWPKNAYTGNQPHAELSASTTA